MADDEMLCACMQVRLSVVRRQVEAGADAAAIARLTAAGTGCGRCRARIRRLVRRARWRRWLRFLR